MSVESSSTVCEVAESLGLPRVELDPESRRNRSSYYGADRVAARYCGFDEPPAPIRGCWQHGWVPPHAKYAPAKVMTDNLADRDAQYWVARDDECVYMVEHGYPNTEAIGLPFAYLPVEAEVARRAGSLLVMPVHGLDYFRVRVECARYVEHILGFATEFDEIVACVHPSCEQSGLWLSEFSEAGIPVVIGANLEDRNALFRMSKLFSTFEYLTTNGYGSHLVYAAALGAKLSISGPFPEARAEDFNNALFYRSHPDLVAPRLIAFSEQTFRKHYPQLFGPPSQAKAAVDWGRREIGFDNRLPPAELRRRFGWTPARLAQNRLSKAAGVIRDQASRWMPPALEQGARIAFRPDYRVARRERKRLSRLPAGVAAVTTLDGSPFRAVDGRSYPARHSAVFGLDRYRFVSAKKSPLVIDCGAGDGLGVVYFKRLFPECRIVAFEADPVACEALRENCALRGFGASVEIVAAAAWTDAGTVGFRRNSAQGGHVATHTAPAPGWVLVPAQRLRDRILGRTVDLLKLTLGGQEADVLSDCSDALGEVENLFVEYHSFADREQRLHEILALLAGAGFRVHLRTEGMALHPFVHRPVRWGRDQCLHLYAFR